MKPCLEERETAYISVGGKECMYRSAGPETSKQDMVLVHGTSGIFLIAVISPGTSKSRHCLEQREKMNISVGGIFGWISKKKNALRGRVFFFGLARIRATHDLDQPKHSWIPSAHVSSNDSWIPTPLKDSWIPTPPKTSWIPTSPKDSQLT